MTTYLVYDVFSKTPFGGNQLAIVPDASTLPETDLQKIAREFNYSETTFVFPPTDPANDAHVRIFTPTMEIPFAGHPLIGTACALGTIKEKDELRLELGIGVVSCKTNGHQASFTVDKPLEIMSEPDPLLVAKALSVSTSDLNFACHPPTMASLGLAFTITEVKDRKTLSRLVTDISSFRKGRDEFPSSLDFAQFAYCRDGNSIHARMFAPLDNIPEDPATGSACATLAMLLAKSTDSDIKLRIRQGEDMGRPSEILVETTGQKVTVSGDACKVMEGTLLHR